MHRPSIQRAYRALTAYGTWLGLATLVFAVWYVLFLFPHRAVSGLSTLTGIVHATVPLVPPISDGSIRTAVGTVVSLGLPATVFAFIVGFGLFHRQAETA